MQQLKYLLYLSGLKIGLVGTTSVAFSFAVISKLLKEIIKQPRPQGTCDHLGNCGEPGMPSSHAQFMSFCCIVALMLYRRRYELARKATNSFISHLMMSLFYKIEMALLFIVSGLICVARVYLGYHSSTQVVAGIVLGSLAGRYWITTMSYLNESGILDRACSILMPIIPLQNSWWPR